MGKLERLLQEGSTSLVLVSIEDLTQFGREIAQRAIDEAKSLTQSKNNEAEDERLTTKEVSQRYRVSAPTLWRWQKSGLLHPLKVGAKNVYLRSEIESIMRRGV